jgi:hypothetical protein
MIKIKIEGEGLNFEAEGSIAQAGQIISFLGQSRNETSSVYPPTNQIIAAHHVPTTATPREFLVRTNARTNPEKITALGVYMIDEKGNPSFSRKEIEELLRKSGEKVPKNMARDLDKAVQLAYIYPLDSTRDYDITETGRTAVESGFATKTKATTHRTPKKRSMIHDDTASTSDIRETIKNATIDPSGSGDAPDFAQTPTKKMKIVWLLNWAKSNNLEPLTRKEIEALALKLRDSIPARDFSGHTKDIIRNGLIVEVGNSGGFQIQRSGIDALRTLITDKLTPDDIA